MASGPISAMTEGFSVQLSKDVAKQSVKLDQSALIADKNAPHSCFHCLEPVPEYCNLTVKINGESRAMCCIGCKSAAEFIVDRGLTRFYEHRVRLEHKDFFGEVVAHTIKPGSIKALAKKWQHLDSSQKQPAFIDIDQDGRRSFSAVIDGLYCSSCTWLLEKALNKLSHGIEFQADIDAHCVHIRINDDTVPISHVLATIESLGYRPNICQLGDSSLFKSAIKEQKNKALIRIIVAGFGMMQVMTYATAGYFGGSAEVDSAMAMQPQLERFFLLVSMLVSTIVVFYSGKPFFVNAINDLHNRHLGMDVPVALAIAGAYIPSVYEVFSQANSFVYFDSAVMFVFFLSLGRYIEMRARHKLQGSSTDLNQVLPSKIKIQRGQEGQYDALSIKPSEVLPGDLARLKTDETVPFDSVIRCGEIQVDESLVTGEAIAIRKSTDHKLLAGTRVLSGMADIESTGNWSESSISKIQDSLRKAQHASQNESECNRLVSRFFILIILLLTLLVSVIWAFIQPDRVFDICLAMLIASCPCAFSLAAPIGRSAAIHYLRSKGILITNSVALNTLVRATAWCFDKTGTLTKGEPSIKNVRCLSTVSQKKCLEIVATLEQESDHILARAFSNIESSLSVTDLNEEIGLGVHAKINGDYYRVGKRSWILELFPNTQGQLDQVPESGIEVVLANSIEVIAVIQLHDEIRPSAFEFLGKLISGGNYVGVLSGDNESSVTKLCDTLGVKQQEYSLLPEGKLRKIKQLQSNKHIVVMIGDGINDAPVLAQSDISIAMASGSNLALNNSDVILLNGDLGKLDILRTIVIRLDKITLQNLSWALAYNVLALPLAATGFLTPWIAALGMSVSSLVVVLNALRIRTR